MSRGSGRWGPETRRRLPALGDGPWYSASPVKQDSYEVTGNLMGIPERILCVGK